jgi:rhodanese-related sulfurtransferase
MFDTAIDTQTKVSWNLFPGDAQALIEENKNRDDFVIVDVCSPQEFKDRHLENAININFISKSFKLRLTTLDKDKTYLVYCKVGGRSKLAQRTMRKLGFKKVYNLVGGTFLWEEEELPFASGGATHQFVFCPVFMSALVIIKIRKMLKVGCRSLADAMAKVGGFGEKTGIQLPILTKPCSGCCR